MTALAIQRRHLIPFRSSLLPQIFTDTLVVGSGVAGLRCAIEASSHGDVIVLAKESLDLSSTNWAQGGISAVLDPADTFDAHVQDTLVAGAGLCKPDIVRLCVENAPERIRDLIELGTRFSRGNDPSLGGGFELALERDADAVQETSGHVSVVDPLV